METTYYLGLDVHKKTIAYCIKTVAGKTVEQGVISADRKSLREWLTKLPGPWIGAMEATIFTGWDCPPCRANKKGLYLCYQR